MMKLIYTTALTAFLASPGFADGVLILYPNAPAGAEATGCNMNLWVDRNGYWNNRDCPAVVDSRDIPAEEEEPTPDVPGGEEPKPGHGHGDENHDHSGPKGK